MSAPLAMRWNGEALEPLSPTWAKRCDTELVIGERYMVETIEERSARSHNHYFAAVHEAWLNLPEGDAERFATAEHLRKWALIKAGYHDNRSIACSSKAEAQRLGAFVRPLDDFALVVVTEALVTVYTAKSQSQRAMGKEAFQASKDAVLAVLADLLDVTPEQLSRSSQGAGDPNKVAREAVKQPVPA